MTSTKERRVRMSVRTRVLAGLVVMNALALAVAGFTAFYLERDRLDASLDEALTRNASEFEELAASGVDPDTGAAFDSVSRLLRIGLQRIAMAPNEGIIGLVDDQLEWRAPPPPTVTLRLEEDAELMAALSERLDDGVVTTITTSTTTYRVAIVPVQVPADPQPGTLVMAFDRSAEHAILADTYRLYALVAAGSLLVITAVAWFTVGRLLRPIKLLRSAAQDVSSSDLSRRIPVVGNDDLAVLTETVNSMLERLEGAFTSQRQLLDDAGHELRTPLTIVQGHLELMDPDDAEDTAATKTLALDELDRMNRLVDDLMTLARARRPDFISVRPTDIALFTDEVLTKARLLGERDWSLDSLATVTCAVDPQRLTQAVLQLCANAVRFSEPGSAIAVGSRLDPDRLRIWVRDEGRGIAAEDITRVFNRFERLNGDVEGSGLGLPIVRSVALAHGGDVEVASELGQGTMMTLALPVHGAPVSLGAVTETEQHA